MSFSKDLFTSCRGCQHGLQTHKRSRDSNIGRPLMVSYGLNTFPVTRGDTRGCCSFPLPPPPPPLSHSRRHHPRHRYPGARWVPGTALRALHTHRVIHSNILHEESPVQRRETIYPADRACTGQGALFHSVLPDATGCAQHPTVTLPVHTYCWT